MQMKAKDLQTQSTEELNNQLATLKEELFNLRFQHATGQLDNPIRIRGSQKRLRQNKNRNCAEEK
jgi:large subunit ribosomal protein L29